MWLTDLIKKHSFFNLRNLNEHRKRAELETRILAISSPRRFFGTKEVMSLVPAALSIKEQTNRAQDVKSCWVSQSLSILMRAVLFERALIHPFRA